MLTNKQKKKNKDNWRKAEQVQECNVDSSLIVSSKTEFNQQTVRVPN